MVNTGVFLHVSCAVLLFILPLIQKTFMLVAMKGVHSLMEDERKLKLSICPSRIYCVVRDSCSGQTDNCINWKLPGLASRLRSAHGHTVNSNKNSMHEPNYWGREMGYGNTVVYEIRL